MVRQRSPCRFFKAFIVAILVWILFGSLLRHSWLHRYKYGPRPHWGIEPGDQNMDYPLPPGVDLLACDEPLFDGPGPSVTSFEIASPSETLLLLSAGAWLSGSVRVTTSASTDFIRFSVTTKVIGWHWANTANTIVCSLKRNEGEFGVGIFNPTTAEPPHHQVQYDALVELPEGSPFINRFETHVVNTQQHFDDLQGKIFFEYLNLHGSNGGIKAQSLGAYVANLRTSNSAIEGSFNASDELVIATSNSRVDIDVDFNQLRSSRAKLSITTDNGPLKADIRLHDLRIAQPSTKTSFSVLTHTSNSPLDVAFRDAPIDSLLTYRGSTSNSPANIFLHPTFQGRFTLATHSAWSNPIVHQHWVDDPAGRGRTRLVTYRNLRGYVQGDITWGDADGEKGEVIVDTSNAGLTLDL